MDEAWKANLKIVGDRSIEYASPWAGANWCSMAHDNGPLEGYDRVTFERFAKMVDREGLGEETGLSRMALRAVFDAEIEECGKIPSTVSLSYNICSGKANHCVGGPQIF